MMLQAAYSTISAASIAQAVDQNYALGPVRGCRLFMRGFNDTYEFEGAGGRRYMARLCDRRFRGPANVDYETSFLRRLQQSGLVVGAPVEARDGRLWRMLDAPEGPREFAVFERLTGRMPLAALQRTGKADGQTLADVRALGASLAQIHLAGEGFQGPASLYRLDEAHLLEHPLAQILAVVGEPLAAEAREIGDALRTRLGERAGELSVGHCHGDNHGGNALISEGADGRPVVGWFDFDDGGPGFLAYDLATFLWSFLSFTRSADMGEASRPLWPAFIAGYREVRPIPDPDYAAVGLFVSVRHINFSGQYASRIPEWGAGFVSDDWFRRALQLLRLWDGLVTP
jgi:Ser/Thr protein kinase RdoA (MazF antagonist)